MDEKLKARGVVGAMTLSAIEAVKKMDPEKDYNPDESFDIGLKMGEIVVALAVGVLEFAPDSLSVRLTGLGREVQKIILDTDQKPTKP